MTLPQLALGAAQWGMPYGIANRTGPPSRSDLAVMLKTARAHGVCSIDTARDYGASEDVIGTLTQGDEYWHITTKLSAALTAQHDVRRAQMSLVESRTRLRRPSIDTLLLHRWDHRHAAHGRVWDWLLDERARGGIDALGVSAVGPDDAFAALDDPDVEVVQVPVSLLDQRLPRAGFFEAAADRGKSVVVRSVFLQGVAHLDPSELPDWLAELADPIRTVAKEAAHYAVGAAAAFLLYAATLPAHAVLIGAEHARQLEADLEVWRQRPIPESALRQIAESISDLSSDLLDPSRWPSSH